MTKTNARPSDAEVSFIEQTIQRAYGAVAKYEGAEVVNETWEGKTMWVGEVHVVSVGRPDASRAYAWFYEGDDGKRRIKTVLGVGSITSATMAVRASIVVSTPKATH